MTLRQETITLLQYAVTWPDGCLNLFCRLKFLIGDGYIKHGDCVDARACFGERR